MPYRTKLHNAAQSSASNKNQGDEGRSCLSNLWRCGDDDPGYFRYAAAGARRESRALSALWGKILRRLVSYCRLTLKKHFLSLFAPMLLVLAYVGCTEAPEQSVHGRRIALKPCQLSAPGSATRLRAECGKLTVYEDRATQSGRRIELHIAVIPALSRTPEPDPLFFITGGPGEASTEDYVRVSAAFGRLNGKRDIVLADQRGTGKSSPLKCAPMVEESDANDDAEIETGIRSCLKQLNADTRFYGTLPAVDDLDQVRAALGYDKINLYGISYGTRVAQTYMRNYSSHVRAVILDGVVPQDEALGVEMASDAQKSLDAIFMRCADDAECGRAFPGLPGDFDALLNRVKAKPVKITRMASG